MYAFSNHHNQFTSIDTVKLLQLKRDIEDLQPGQSQQTGHNQTVEILRPVVQDALKRGCSVRAITALLQFYKLDVPPSSIGINRPF